MKKNFFYLTGLMLILATMGCVTIKGATKAEQRNYVQDMKKETLNKLYQSTPFAKSQIKDAAGYGVFSNLNTNLFLLSMGSGYGMVTDNKSGDVTYMKMASVGGGLGMGIKDFRAVINFIQKYYHKPRLEELTRQEAAKLIESLKNIQLRSAKNDA